MPTVWEYTYDCVQQYMRALARYLMTVSSSSYGIIMYRAINVPDNGNNAVDGINATDKNGFK